MAGLEGSWGDSRPIGGDRRWAEAAVAGDGRQPVGGRGKEREGLAYEWGWAAAKELVYIALFILLSCITNICLI